MRTIAGFLKPAAGSVRLEGGDGERTLAEQAHFVGHLNGLKSTLTVVENIRFWASYLAAESGSAAPQERTARITEALAHFGVDDLAAIPVGFLSAGQKRRVALARLLAVHRRLWLLDEPTSSLDAASSKLVAAAIERHAAEGGLTIVATHLPLGLARMHELRLGGGAAEAA
jgi:heme exporter protein A